MMAGSYYMTSYHDSPLFEATTLASRSVSQVSFPPSTNMQPVSVLSFVDPMDELNQLDFGFTSDIDSRFSDDSPPDYRASMGLQDGLLAAFASNDDLIPSPICAKNQGTEEAREQFLPAILSFEDNFDIPVADELSYDINEFPQVNDFGMMSDAGFGLGSPPQTVPQTPPPLIPTTVLEITRNETIVGNGCGANVSINDEPNQHFLLRKFLSDGSSFADERQEFEKALLLSTDYSDVKIESGVSSPADFGQQAAETQVDFFDVDTMMQSTTSPESAQYDDADLEPIFSNLMHHMRTEFEGTCSLLQISTNPTMWTVEDVHKWISLSAKQYNMKPVDLTKFAVDGATLLCFTEEEFKERAGDAGSALHAALYSWTAAMPSVCDVTIAQVASPAESGFASGAEAGESTPLSLHGNMISGYEGMDSDEDDDCDGAEKPAAGGRSGNAHIQLWQFLKELLCDGKHYGACIRWLDRPSGVFKIEDSVRVARLWGRRKNRPAMNYDKLSRSIRQYYKKGIMKKTERSQRLVYQFCSPYLN